MDDPIPLHLSNSNLAHECACQLRASSISLVRRSLVSANLPHAQGYRYVVVERAAVSALRIAPMSQTCLLRTFAHEREAVPTLNQSRDDARVYLRATRGIWWLPSLAALLHSHHGHVRSIGILLLGPLTHMHGADETITTLPVRFPGRPLTSRSRIDPPMST